MFKLAEISSSQIIQYLNGLKKLKFQVNFFFSNLSVEIYALNLEFVMIESEICLINSLILVEIYAI
jgi:hypothetical protein